MTYHGVCNKSNTTDVTCGAELAYPPVVYEFTPVHCKVCVTRPLVSTPDKILVPWFLGPYSGF
jgi:hypothetical protein